MKLFYCTVVSFFIASSVFAQEKKLLQNFKYRIDRFRAISAETNSNSYIGNFSNTANNDKRSFVNFNLRGKFYNFKNTDSKRVILQIDEENNINYGKQGNNGPILKQKNASNYTSVGVFKTWFHKGLFFEIGSGISGNFVRGQNKDLSNVKLTKNKINTFNYYGTIGIGTGRIENIIDMQNALWLNKILKADNNLSRDLSDAELNDLGKAITKGNNTRILDARRKTKFLLKTVDNYLQEKGVIEKINIDYFNNLNDILFFAFNNQRYSGTEIYFRVNPTFNAANRIEDFYNNNSDNNFKDESKFGSITAGFKRYKPQNLTHQNNYGAAISLSSRNTKNMETRSFLNVPYYEKKINDKINQTSLDLFYEHSIYPNTRTALNFFVNTNMGRQIYNTEKQNYLIANLGSEMSYFISYNTRINASLVGDYNTNKIFNNILFNNYSNLFSLQSKIGLELNF